MNGQRGREIERVTSEYKELGEFGMVIVLLHRLQSRRNDVAERERMYRNRKNTNLADIASKQWIELDKAVVLVQHLYAVLKPYADTDGIMLMLENYPHWGGLNWSDNGRYHNEK